MANITIRNVPDDVRDKIAARAALAGKSMQEYLLGELRGMVDKPTVAEVMERIGELKASMKSSVTSKDILRFQREARRG